MSSHRKYKYLAFFLIIGIIFWQCGKPGVYLRKHTTTIFVNITIIRLQNKE